MLAKICSLGSNGVHQETEGECAGKAGRRGGHRAFRVCGCTPGWKPQELSVRCPSDVSLFGSLQPFTVLPLGHTCGRVCFWALRAGPLWQITKCGPDKAAKDTFVLFSVWHRRKASPLSCLNIHKGLSIPSVLTPREF